MTTLIRTFAFLASLGLASLVPGQVHAAGAYEVSARPTPFTPLPIAGADAGPVWTFDPDSTTAPSSPHGSADARLPFPVRFFDELYTEANVSTFGYFTFGARSTARCVNTASNCAHQYANQAIPSAVLPNRVIAVWWDNLNVTNGGTLKAQVLGAAPHRRYVIEWTNVGIPLDWRERLNAQLWLTEGSSTLEFRYGSISGPPGVSALSASVGIGSPVAGGKVEGYTALGCTPTCTRANWPTDTALVFTQGADLEVRSVDAPLLGTLGFPVHVTATVANAGGRTAGAFPVSFSLSRSPVLDGGSRHLGTVAGAGGGLAPGGTGVFDLDAILPKDLDAGTWYVVAQADPQAIVDETVRANNVLASAPMALESVGPYLRVLRVEAPARLAPGSPFMMGVAFHNVGSIDLSDVPFAVALSPAKGVGPANRRLLEGRITADIDEEREVVIEVPLPGDVPEGPWFLGVIADPDATLPSLNHQDNIGVTPGPVLIASPAVGIVTGDLPPAMLGSAFCVRLDATGGSGRYVWSLVSGWTLPPGLDLVEFPAGARSAGMPYVTRLCGRPTAVGHFEFMLKVASGTLAEGRTFALDVEREALLLRIATSALPSALFQRPYEARLALAGGEAPWTWSLAEGSLPLGLFLREDGILLGAASEDGRFPITIRVIDGGGAVATQQMELLVASPSRLTCVTGSLPPLQLGEPASGQLVAAGGVKPYRWRSLETRRLPSRPGEKSTSLGNVLPPGFTFLGSGSFAGAAAEAGAWLWTVEVLDLAPIPAAARCTIAFEVLADRGLAIASRALAPAIAGQAYAAQLEATGGEGRFTWSLGGRDKLHLASLTPGGVVEGTPSIDALGGLDGGETTTWAFTVEVRDEKGRHALAPIAIEVLAEAPTRIVPAPPEEATGCSAGSTAGSLWALAGSLALLRRRGGSGFPSGDGCPTQQADPTESS